ncbi:MAG: YlbF family regulator [Lachnospiraceae bacterium]|nr:YlbF family regulator [Lachnospiraceae bacterium]MBQ2101425.1 YlbF family regulator [Lachnospiraceae bacterium]MBQ3905506.1 YlbF family regulator [Lachnospiraceae bacterium]
MNEVDEAVEALEKALLNSEVYKEYQRALAEVKKVPDLKAQIDEYRARNYELQQSPDYAFDKMEQFQREYKSFRENSLVSDFLAAELAFCRLVQGIESRLVEHIDFE